MVMPHYLFQWTYENASIKAMVADPHNREAEVRKAVEAFGGKLHQFFYAFGEADGIAIVEFPDNKSCSACSLTLGSGGAARLWTTALMTMEEGWQAMQTAKEATPGYRPPIGYASHG
jgi:uncharacterized protein with GYD domain